VVVRATYEYDGLDRPVLTRECHTQLDCAASSWWVKGRQTALAYLGSSSQVAKETITGDARQSKTKRYSYDPYGGRNALETTNTSDQTANYTYAYDAHGSVGLLVQSDGGVQASYGYDPYGGEDEKLTKELKQGSSSLITPATDPLNAYRYTGHREDTGSGMIDMGARRFSPDTARFLSSDFYAGALSDIGLSTDPLTQNRYALAGGNPVGYVEVDGHGAIDGNGQNNAKAAKRRATALAAAAAGGSAEDTWHDSPGPSPSSPSTAHSAPDAADPSEHLALQIGQWCSRPPCGAGGGAEEVDDFDYLTGPSGTVKQGAKRGIRPAKWALTKLFSRFARKSADDVTMAGRKLGHTFSKHGQANTHQLRMEAAATGRPVGQWLDDEAAERLIAEHIDDLRYGPVTVEIPKGLGRIIHPDGSYTPASVAVLVPSGSGVKTAYPKFF
jgi:RHS repeat-associated protein